MVILETEHKQLNKILGRKLEIKELEEILFSLGYELENVEGDKLRIDITAERPDLLSTYGLGRLLRSYLGNKNEEIKINKSNYKLNVKQPAKEWTNTAAAVVKGLKLDDQKIREIIRVQEKIGSTFLRNRKKGAIGIYPLEKIKFPITFTAEKPEQIKFRPLEYNKEINGREILEKHPTGMKYKHLLERWEKYPLFKDSNNKILSMPPIINSHELGRVDERTTEVFVEVSGKDIQTIRMALNVMVSALAGIGGKIYSVEIDNGNKIITPEFKGEKRTIEVGYVNKILGTSLKTNEVKKLLEKMNHKVVKTNTDSLILIVDPLRSDIWHDIDIADDIARTYGFNNLELRMKNVESVGETTRSVKVKDEISKLLTGLGYQECFTLMLTNNETQFEKMNIKEPGYVKLGTTVEQGINMMRQWLLPELMKSLENNRSAEYPQKLFEISHTTVIDNTKDVGCKDILKLSIVNCHANANFTEMKQVLDYLFNALGIKYELTEVEHETFIKGRNAKIKVENEHVGNFGEINPKVLENFGIEMPCTGLEINLSELFKL
ncbi:MAG: phenylalanine--tRNA ligase subunit beta [Nanoarchaeota archaeon]